MAARDDWKTAPMDEGQRAMLDFLAKDTLDHENVGPADIERLHERGVTDEQIVDALHVGFAFNVITRMADALGWDVPDDVSFHRSAKFLLKFGYNS